MTQPSPEGPDWVGIGAQRSGTTWFVDLLTQHPLVTLGRSNRKELHLLETGLIIPVEELGARVTDEFAGVDTVAGEFTPAYLRCPWVPQVAREVLPPETSFFVLLRDPVDRFASAMAHEIARAGWKDPSEAPLDHLASWSKFRGVDAVWAGMYARHLNTWLRTFSRDRFFVIQYERMVADPVSVIAEAHRALDLQPVALTDPAKPSSTTTQPGDEWDWSRVEWLEKELIEIYRDEVAQLADEWDIDTSLWPRFDN